MSATKLPLADKTVPCSPGAWVRVALAEFAARDTALAWSSLRENIETAWPDPLPERLRRLVADHGLDLRDVLLLAVAGEVETSHAVDIAIAELQAPAAAAWPSVHLCVALVGALFDQPRFTAQHLHDSALVQAGLLELVGDGPLPLRSVRVHPALWATLAGGAKGWPGTHPLATTGSAPVPAHLAKQLDALASAFCAGAIRGAVLRGQPASGRGANAAALAQRARRHPVEVPAALWQEQPALRAAARYANWLAVVRVDLGPGEVWRAAGAHEPPSPIAIVVGGDGAVQGEGLLEIDVPMLACAERRLVWRRTLGEDDPATVALVDRAAREQLISAPAIRAVAAHAR
ncbi:MAG: hypothetical protein P8Y53_03600, partial [Pseudolabrys sp.]